MWTPDFKGFLLPATLFLNHYIPGKPWMHKALICGCNQLSTSATLLLWSQSAFYLLSFTSGIIWHKDFQSGWMLVLGHLCASLLLKGWHTQACCCNRLLHICWSIVLALGWQARWSNFCWFGPQWKRNYLTFVRVQEHAWEGAAPQTRLCITTCSPSAICEALLWLPQKFFLTSLNLKERKEGIIHRYIAYIDTYVILVVNVFL